MKKTLIMLFVLVFSLGAIASHLVGTIITQQQFDNLNFQSRGLEINIESKAISQSNVRIGISYSTLEQLESGDWEVVLRKKTLTFHLEDYHDCRVEGNSKAKCTQLAVNFLKTQAKEFRQSIRNDLESRKTKAFIDELTIQDINITSNELNE